MSRFFNPVPVSPTQTEIDIATRLVQYSTIQNPIAETCPISLDRFASTDYVREILHCRHIFTPTHFAEWFTNHVACPVCRYDIRDYIPSSTPSSTTPSTPSSTTSSTTPSTPSSTTSTTSTNANALSQQLLANLNDILTQGDLIALI